jgi:hypothetical protein
MYAAAGFLTHPTHTCTADVSPGVLIQLVNLSITLMPRAM